MVCNLVIFSLYALVNTKNWIEHHVYKMQLKLTLFERVVLVFLYCLLLNSLVLRMFSQLRIK